MEPSEALTLRSAGGCARSGRLLRRRRPGFNEAYYGFRTFGQLLEEARDRGVLEMEFDSKSGGYLIRRCNTH